MKDSIDHATPADWNRQRKPAQKNDPVNFPAHYNQDGGIECIDAIKAQLTHEQFLGYLRGTIAKYTWRMMDKHPHPHQDAAKIKWFASYLEQYLSKDAKGRS